MIRHAAAFALAVFAATTGAQENPRALMMEGQRLYRANEGDRALIVLDEARTLFAARSDRISEAEVLIIVADVLRESGAAARAVPVLDEALALLDGLGEPFWEARVLRQRAQARSQAGDADGGFGDLEAAADIFRRLGKPVDAAGVDAVRAVMASQLGRFRDAVTYGERALSALAGAGRDADELGALSAVAYGLQELGEPDRALAAYNGLIERAWQRGDQRLVVFAYCNRAQIRWQQGEAKASEEDRHRAIAGFEAAWARLPATAPERATYLERQVDAYDNLIVLLADTYRGVEGFAIAERFRARAFLDMLNEAVLDRAASGQEGLRSRERELLDALGRTRLELEAGADVRPRLEELEIDLAQLHATLRLRDPRYAELVAPRPPEEAQVREALRPDEALAAYWILDDRLLIWTLTRERLRFAEVPVARAELARAVADYLEPLRSPARAEDVFLRGGEEAHLELGRRLHRWLVGSLPRAVREKDTLIVVPDDFLHYLPFGSLVAECDEAVEETADRAVFEAYRGCRYLGLDKALAYTPSAGVFLSLRQRRAERREALPSLLAMAPSFDGETAALRGGLAPGPLRHSQQEARAAAGFFAAGRSYFGADASEGRFKDEAGRHPYVHLATHGLVSDELPMTSGVLLAAGDGEDGLLQAHEVLALRLEADLVTLSACRTGRGELRRGEGILGLSRAFLYAGASSVAVTHWDVDDRSTLLLTRELYRRLTAGASRAEALREARRTLFGETGEMRLVLSRRPVAYAHPRFWSALVLIGEPD